MKNKESIGNHLIRTYNAENKEEVQLHFTHSDNDVITIVLCLHIATPTTLKNKLNRHNQKPVLIKYSKLTNNNNLIFDTKDRSCFYL